MNATENSTFDALSWRRLDKDWAAFSLALLMILVLDGSQLLPSVTFTLRAFTSTLPFFLMAIMTAAYAKASSAENLIARVFSGNVFVMIFVAAIVGGLSPFCSCGVILLIAALLAMGVPLPAVMA
jgi:hypothetical protein